MTEKNAPFPRVLQVLLGAILGFGWGSFLWFVTGQRGGARIWLYIALTCAMIGCGVAAIFGARIVRQQGERVSPRAPRFRRRG